MRDYALETLADPGAVLVVEYSSGVGRLAEGHFGIQLLALLIRDCLESLTYTQERER